MPNLESLVDEATRSEFFTSPRLVEDLPKFLAAHGERIRQLARRVAAGEFDHVYFVGSGGSWATVYSGKYLLDRLTDVPSDVLSGYELTWRDPSRLNRRSLVLLASYSGGTEDTLRALHLANERGAHTAVLTRRSRSPMAQGAGELVDYDSPALYALPLAALYAFALELARLTGSPRAGEAESALAGFESLPTILGRVFREAQKSAEVQARSFLSSNLLYVLAAGPNYGLGYKFALTVFMENIRVNGSIIEATEFRQGPVEALERQRLDVVALLGTDESRGLTERAVDFAKRNGARVAVFDVAAYADVHPLLAPFVLLVPLEWFTVYSALLRGISDLDERVFMGHRLLAAGADASWP